MIQNGLKTTVVGLFNRAEDADRAIQSLKQSGIEETQISLLTREQTTPDIKNEYLSTQEEVTFGRLAGAATGATVGVFAGALIGLSAVAIPGVGPILSAGALATVLGSAVAGSGVGALAGGLLVGSLARLGLPEEEAHLYAEGVKRGGVLVAVQTDDAHVQEAEHLLSEANAVDMNVLREKWQEDGWSRFDETVEPNGNYPKL
jgi:hypothetical protein